MILNVHNLHFSYGDKKILRGLTFELPLGNVAAILGENGSGKTTLLRNINGLLRPRIGTVMVGDAAVENMNRREIARHFGYMPQRQVEVHCTVFDAVLLGRKARDGGRTGQKDIDRIEQILTLVNLKPLAMRPTTELSGGELQKVVLARALAQEPKVLLLDEPINHLDPVNQIEVMSILHAASRSMGIATLMVTHHLNHALRFADRFILLSRGRLLAAGERDVLTPETIREAFHIDVVFGEVGGVTVVVPRLHGTRAHQHFTESGQFHEHTHEVDDHVYDHEHKSGHEGHESRRSEGRD